MIRDREVTLMPNHPVHRMVSTEMPAMAGLLVVYYLLSGVTWVQDPDDLTSSVFSRITLSDILMLVLISAVLLFHCEKIQLARLGKASLVTVLIFGGCSMFVENQYTAAVAFLIYLYLVVGFIVIYSVCAAMSVDDRLQMLLWWVRIGGILAAVGLWDFLMPLLGFPSITDMLRLWTGIRAVDVGGLTGTFRNTGQAGAFFQITLACGIPLLLVLSRRRQVEIGIILAVVALALIFTMKRSAMIGTGAGVVMFGLLHYRHGLGKVLVLLVLLVAVSVPVAGWVIETSRAAAGRAERKLFDEMIIYKFYEGFFTSNVQAALASFKNNPIAGAGLAGTRVEGRWEVHSTYLKLFGDTGLLGMLAYGFFIVVLFRSCLIPQHGDPRAVQFARAFVPLLIGLMISWAYTDHLRKREFWIMAALVSSLMAPLSASLLERRAAATDCAD